MIIDGRFVIVHFENVAVSLSFHVCFKFKLYVLVILKACSLVYFVSNQKTNPFMFGYLEKVPVLYVMSKVPQGCCDVDMKYIIVNMCSLHTGKSKMSIKYITFFNK